MSSDPDTILLEAEDQMSKAIDHLRHEFRGIRAGRASPGLVEHVKCEVYGSPTDLKSIAAVNVPEPTQLLVKPFDPSTLHAIKKGIEDANLGLNPQVEDKALRINIPPMSADRRKELVARVKKLGEEQKVVLRNARRDANKHADSLDGLPEDEIKTLHDEIQELLKKYESQINDLAEAKAKEVQEV
ncbi:MAG: ribosome recycling factor [Phycisphaerales bacterium JB040]